MDTPTPVNVDKLRDILSRSKKVMKVVDEKFPAKKPSKKIDESYGDIRPETPFYSENDEREPTYTTPRINNQSQEMLVRDYTEEDVRNSKLPEVIKEAMLKRPISKVGLNPLSRFSLDGLEDLIEKPKIKENKHIETKNSDRLSISKEEINEMIDKRVNEILSKMFTKSISEQAIKKTINTLISEGKLSIKKK